jgi:hypothetical protein
MFVAQKRKIPLFELSGIDLTKNKAVGGGTKAAAQN